MTEQAQKISIQWRRGIMGGLGLGGLAFLLAWVSTGFSGVDGWASFLAMLGLAAGLLWGGWRGLRGETPPRWLGFLLIGAAILRLAAGVLWFVALPVGGHGNPAELGGYVMEDARHRDQAAWELAQSDDSLLKAFSRDFRMADQYGGLLFVSAAFYRTLGGTVHQPLQMAVLTAAFSSLAVLFTWGFVRRAWDDKTAWLAAWVLAVYPEAVMLGSSQMREAFTVTLLMAAVYGLIHYWQERSRVGLAWTLGALLICLPLSPPVAVLIAGTLGILALAMGEWQALRKPRFWLAAGGLAALALVGAWLFWDKIAPQGVASPLEIFQYWVVEIARWQAYYAERASGWLQKIFNSTPEWTHIPFLLGYGVVQPLLPAALVAPSTPIWYGLAVWRATGWTLLLAALLYATLRSFRFKNWRGLPLGISLVVWAGILVSSYRGGGDQWDNPRYRATFAGLQIALAAWAWIEQRRSPDPWLRRALVGAGLVAAWFMPWYLRRYTPLEWPVVDLFKTAGLGLITAALYWLWDWARMENDET